MNAISIDTKLFTSELEWCARFIERKTSISILSNVLFQKRAQFLYLTATDLEIAGLTSVELDGEEAADFELCAPVQLLIKYLKKVDESTVRLIPEIIWSPLYEGPHPEECRESCRCNLEQTITRISLRLEHGEDGCVSVDGLPAESYPELPKRPLSSVELYDLETAIPRALIAISNEGSRFTLNGALLKIKGKQARLISTDGHRLSYAHLKSHDHGDAHALIPRKALAELLRLGDSAFFCCDENHAFFSAGVRTILARKLTGNFPDYERVLPKELAYAIDVSVAPFRRVLDRVALFADERSRAIAITVNGSLTLSAKTYDHGAADGKISIDAVRRLDSDNGYDVLPQGLACPYLSGFNAEYLMDFLKTAGVPDVRFLFNHAKDAVEWTAPGWRYVLMPMRMENSCDPYAVGDFEPVPAVIAALDAQIEQAIVPSVETVPIAIPAIPDAPVTPAPIPTPIDTSDIRARAIALRQQRVSLSAIAKQLNAPQSSVWRWTRGIEALA